MSSSIEITRILIDVAMGRQEADLVVRKGTWVCVQSGEFVPGMDVAVKEGRIAYVGPDAAHTIGESDADHRSGRPLLVPARACWTDTHVEFGMLTVTEFVRAVLPCGTTGMFIDPHEIANVFGLKGVKLMAGPGRPAASAHVGAGARPACRRLPVSRRPAQNSVWEEIRRGAHLAGRDRTG